jgi:hypothetical protein
VHRRELELDYVVERKDVLHDRAEPLDPSPSLSRRSLQATSNRGPSAMTRVRCVCSAIAAPSAADRFNRLSRGDKLSESCKGAKAREPELYGQRARTRSIFCFASATASSFRGAKVFSVDRVIRGRSACVA